jgi:glycosyltransferase involved in cell wall biosynthesis
MNILLVNHYAGGPEFGMEFRSYYLAKEWVKMGHNVTVVSGTYSHLRKKNPKINGFYQEKNNDGIKHIWIKTPSYSGNGVKRVLSMFSFVGQIILYKKRIINASNPDVVIASSTYPLDIHAVKILADKVKAKSIFEVHDLWPLTPMELGGISRNHPFIKLLQHAEDKAYKNVDSVVSILPCAKEYMVSRGMPSEKFHHVPNGVVIEDWTSNKKTLSNDHKVKLEELKNQGKFIVGYAGGHGISNSLKTLIQSSEKIAVNVAIVLVGEGPEKHNLIECEKEIGKGNVFFLPSINKFEIPSLLEMFDCCYIAASQSTLYRFGVSPNKIYDYMMAKKPIIQAINAANDIVIDADCGVSIASENTEQLVDAISTLSKLSKPELERLGLNGYKYVMEHHDYAKLAKNFLDAMFMEDTTNE